MKKIGLVTEAINIAPEGIEELHPDNLNKIDPGEYTCWLVDMMQWRSGWKILMHIRTQLEPSIYLRPIICINASEEIPKEIRKSADGYINLGEYNEQRLTEWLSRFQGINRWIDRLGQTSGTADTNIAMRVLRLLASRDKEQTPLTTSRRVSGFVYPLLEPLFSKRDSSILETLNFLHDQRILSGRFIQKAHFCSHCDSAFLNFMEACPQCNSNELEIDELVHHFKCAYVGEVSEYRQGERMVCPKCDRELNHIGVDYDKPSIVYRCQQCNHHFQDPKIMSACYNCGRSTEPENQMHRDIQAYSVTAIGHNAAQFGLDTLFTRILKTELNLHNYDAFRDFYNIETSRINRYKKSSSSLVILSIQGMDELYIRLGRRSSEVYSEMSAVFRTVLRTSDVITARNESLFIVIMTETDTNASQRAVERLQEGIISLLQNNLNITPQLSVDIRPIPDKEDLDCALERFLNKHVN